MRVLRGGSAENASGRWVKFDVELDESDVQQLVIEHELDLAKLTLFNKYNLLVKYAELLVTSRMEALGAVGDTSTSELVRELKSYIEVLKTGA